DDYALRDRVRGDVGRRKALGDVFSETAARYWSAVDDLCRAVDQGDASIGLPPYNGGLFDRNRTPLLDRIRLGDRVMADIIDALSFEQGEAGRRYINYRDLGVRQLGSIYERLLEHEVVQDGDEVVVRPNIFARKGSGSYYTPDDLVGLIVEETIGPLVASRLENFVSEAGRVPDAGPARERAVARLGQHDPAEKLLELKVCDPAMGSGHFLVNLVDYLADRVIAAMAEAEAEVEGYVSPLADRIETIRERIAANAAERGWAIDLDRLDDRHIVRRMVLKRCVYGVDKNPMAVELAKVGLWLHTFTVGAPLSFLDHHLRCGDSLFGASARGGIDKAARYGGPLLLHGSVTRAERSAGSMQRIEDLTDAEIAEAHRSAEEFAEVEAATEPLNAVLSLVHAIDWLNVRDREGKTALQSFFGGLLGDPIEIALGRAQVSMEQPESTRFVQLLGEAQRLVREERFLNWQTAFPGVWTNWQSLNPQGGVDGVIRHPPWDRMKLQQVEWFATRRREIALQPRAADRKRMIAALEREGDPLAEDFALASERAATAARMARSGGDYPLLSSGDINLYSLFVERAMALAKPDGMVGLLTPIGIATDMSASQFFSMLVAKQLIRVFYAFENRRGWLFPDIHHEEQPSIAVFSNGANEFSNIRLCVRISGWEQFHDSERRFSVDSSRIARLNPNTGTVPLFRTRRDAELTTAIYERLPVLVDRSSGDEVKSWPVKYFTMFHMTNDSGLFHTRTELEEHERAYPIGGNRYNSPRGKWMPLYEGKSIQLFNHRYASVRVNTDSISGQGVTDPLTHEMLRDPNIVPEPRYWVRDGDIPDLGAGWAIGFNDICNTNNARTLIASIVPAVAFGNKLPIFLPTDLSYLPRLACLAANFGSILCDYVARQKIQSRNLNKYIVEQLPVVPPDDYASVRMGPKSAGQIVSGSVLELTYTAHDMAPFARDMGYVDEDGDVRPPFAWDEERRHYLRAKLDAVFFHLYGVTDRDDVRYVYSTFPIVEREETATYGTYRSRELCLAWMNALAAGHPDAEIAL
ncbi:MAG: restriction endonuclease, partial [Rhodospirillaceae bacterium]|nr:restriction endonuclease [Rhodospirillaceae bacterium]